MSSVNNLSVAFHNPLSARLQSQASTVHLALFALPDLRLGMHDGQLTKLFKRLMRVHALDTTLGSVNNLSVAFHNPLSARLQSQASTVHLALFALPDLRLGMHDGQLTKLFKRSCVYTHWIQL
jgi:hypothetical protein